MKRKNIKLVIADDHAIFIEGLTSLLNNNPEIEIMGTAVSGRETLSILKDNPETDVLISDINMPDIDGIELCKQVKKSYPRISVIALSMHDEARIISNMLKAGASGYLLKKTNREQLLKAITTVLAGQVFISDDVKNAMIESMVPGNSRTSSFLPQLSSREKEVLLLIAREHTTQEIADLLFISSHTVISHRKKLLFKFNSQNTAGLIARASECGLLD